MEETCKCEWCGEEYETRSSLVVELLKKHIAQLARLSLTVWRQADIS